MGNTLRPADILAFHTDMEKSAVKFEGLREVAKRLGSPLQGLKRGWEGLSPVGLINQGGEMGKDLTTAISRTGAAKKALKTGKSVGILNHEGKPLTNLLGNEKMYHGDSTLGRARAHLATKLRAGTHLAPGAKLSGGIEGLAERASRSGWTGEGAVTKYLPFGQKGMLLTGTLASAPGIVDAVKYGPNEMAGGVGEQAGTLAGFTLPAIMAGGMPRASLIAPLLGGFAGGRMGKALDLRLDPRVRQMEEVSE